MPETVSQWLVEARVELELSKPTRFALRFEDEFVRHKILDLLGDMALVGPRPPLPGEAMVDADVEIRGVIAKGNLLTLTTDEALKHKLADFRADTLESALEQLGLGGAELRPDPGCGLPVVVGRAGQMRGGKDY